MGRVIANMTMSLDGFIAGPGDDVSRIFRWFGNGEVEVWHHSPDLPPFHVSPASAEILRRWLRDLGAIVAGRRVFDLTNGWSGRHPLGVPVVIVTHRPPLDWKYPGSSVSFATDGVAAAIERAQALAGDKAVAIATPSIAQQALDLGLLDEIHVDLAPVLLGDGIPFFRAIAADLSDPEIVQGAGVTHLSYRVKR